MLGQRQISFLMDWRHVLLSSVATLWYRVQYREECEHADTLFSTGLVVINEISQESVTVMDWGLPWDHERSGYISIMGGPGLVMDMTSSLCERLPLVAILGVHLASFAGSVQSDAIRNGDGRT